MDFKCIICGSEQAELRLMLPQYQIVECRQCTIMRLWPPPSPKTLQHFYNLAYYTRHLNTWFSRLFMRFFHIYEIKRVKFLRDLQPVGRFLDIGCGAGELLSDMAAAGYEVRGTEVSPAVFEAIPPALHDHVTIGELEDCHFPDASFNLIMLSDVLEHSYNPRQMLKEAARILRRDGTIVISVPNWNDPDAHIFPRAYWHNLDVPIHLWHFTATTLPQLGQRAGLKVVGTLQLGWIELFEAPLSLVHAWERYVRAAGVKPRLARALTWLGTPFLLLLTLIVRVMSLPPRQLRLILKKA